MDLKSLTKSALSTVFNLGPDLVKDATYVRPASFAPATGVTASAESTAAVKILIATYRPRNFGFLVPQPNTDKILIRASELAAITSPAEGDYIVQTSDSLRRDVLFAELDLAGELWIFQTVRTLNLDWGDLTAHTSSEDFGDLASITGSDDWGTLFPGTTTTQ
jgi:hypothetical protein